MRKSQVLCLLSILAASGVLAADDAGLTRKNHRDSTIVSSTNSSEGCLATISIGLKQPSSGLASVALYRLAELQEDTVAVMTARVPLGASLSSGIAYLHPNGSEAVGLVWQYCDEQTCLAGGGVSAAELVQERQAHFSGLHPAACQSVPDRSRILAGVHSRLVGA